MPDLAVTTPTESTFVTSLYVIVPATDTVVAFTVPTVISGVPLRPVALPVTLPVRAPLKVVEVTTPVTLTPLASTVVIPATVMESDNIVAVLATPTNPDPSPTNDVALIIPATASFDEGMVLPTPTLLLVESIVKLTSLINLDRSCFCHLMTF